MNGPKTNEIIQNPTEYWQQRSDKQGIRAVAFVGDSKETMLGKAEQWSEQFLPIVGSQLRLFDRDILDLGCGWGRFYPELTRLRTYTGRSLTYWGMDICSNLLREAHVRWNGGNFLLTEPGKIHLPSNSVDVVWVCTVLQHVVLEEQFQSLVAEIKRVLRPGGLVAMLENTCGKPNKPHIFFREAEDYCKAFLPEIKLRVVSDIDDRGENHSFFISDRDYVADVPEVNETVGIGIVTYHGLRDAMDVITSIRLHTKRSVKIVVYDNSENRSVANHIERSFPEVEILHNSINEGCAVARNEIWKHFKNKHPDIRYLAIMDQDVVVQEGWLDDMLDVMETTPDAGIVAWPLANMGNKSVLESGLVSECSSVCHLHRMQAIAETGGWDARFFFHCFDSLFCQRGNMKGWYTYLVMKYFIQEIPFANQLGKIKHNHPHQGIRRKPNWSQIFRESINLYTSIRRHEQWNLLNVITGAYDGC